MAKLYFYYGAMNSSKTANALMTHFNYEEVGQKALLCKTEADTRDGIKPEIVPPYDKFIFVSITRIPFGKTDCKTLQPGIRLT